MFFTAFVLYVHSNPVQKCQTLAPPEEWWGGISRHIRAGPIAPFGTQQRLFTFSFLSKDNFSIYFKKKFSLTATLVRHYNTLYFSEHKNSLFTTFIVCRNHLRVSPQPFQTLQNSLSSLATGTDLVQSTQIPFQLNFSPYSQWFDWARPEFGADPTVLSVLCTSFQIIYIDSPPLECNQCELATCCIVACGCQFISFIRPIHKLSSPGSCSNSFTVAFLFI